MSTARGEKYYVLVANLKEHLHEKTVQDLVEELQLEFDSALARGEEIDLDVYYAYMDVIEEIEPFKEDPIDPAALFQKVLDEHPELDPDSEMNAPDTKQRPRPKFRMKRVLMIAAVLCVIIILLAVAAYGNKTMKGFQGLGGEQMSFVYGDPGQLELTAPGDNGYHSLAEALADYGLEGVEPTWIPAGYSLVAVDVAEVAAYTNFTAAYENGEKRILIRINAYSEGKYPDSDYERVDEYDEVYRIHGIEHFIMANNERMQVTWENNNILCNIAGPLSESNTKRMIDSIYERD